MQFLISTANSFSIRHCQNPGKRPIENLGISALASTLELTSVYNYILSEIWRPATLLEKVLQKYLAEKFPIT